jgi:hypothetical protein
MGGKSNISPYKKMNIETIVQVSDSAGAIHGNDV